MFGLSRSVFFPGCQDIILSIGLSERAKQLSPRNTSSEALNVGQAQCPSVRKGRSSPLAFGIATGLLTTSHGVKIPALSSVRRHDTGIIRFAQLPCRLVSLPPIPTLSHRPRWVTSRLLVLANHKHFRIVPGILSSEIFGKFAFKILYIHLTKWN